MSNKNFVIFKTNTITLGFNFGYDIKWHTLHLWIEIPFRDIRFGYKIF